jgi:AcrR family transcriptional regulator
MTANPTETTTPSRGDAAEAEAERTDGASARPRRGDAAEAAKPERTDGATAKPLRADARRNRERIIEAARDVFAKQGAGAQMDDIAAAAGVGVGTVYRHFPDKHALMDELVAAKFRAFADNAEVALEVEDPWAAFAGLLRANAELCARDIGIQQAMLREPAAWSLAALELMRLRDLATKLIRRAQKAGVMRKDFVVDDIPMLMGGLSATMAVSQYDWRRHLEIILAGLRA